jgi:Protein of unknown function (DUF4199)
MMSNGVKYGVMGGVFSISLMTILYAFGKQNVVGNELFLVWLLFILAMFMAAYRTRIDAGGYIDFKPCLKESFTAFCISMFLSLIVYYSLLINFIDPSLPIEMREYHLSILKENKFMMDEVEYIKKTTEAKNLAIYFPHIGGMIFQFFLYAPVGFILSTIVAFAVRREKEEF